MRALLLLLLCAPALFASGLEMRHDDEEWTSAKLETISDVVCLAKVTSTELSERKSRNDHVPTRQVIVRLEPVTVYKGELRPQVEFRYWTPDPDAKRSKPWPDHVDISQGETYIFYLKDNTEYYYPALQGKFDDGASVHQPATKQNYKVNWDF